MRKVRLHGVQGTERLITTKRAGKPSPSSLLSNFLIASAVLVLIYIVITGLGGTIAGFANSQGYIGKNTLTYVDYLVSLLGLSLSVFVYLKLYKSVIAKRMPLELGFGYSRFSLKNIEMGLILFSIVLCLELVVGLVGAMTGVQINTNVGEVLGGAPGWFLFFAAVIEPINEEIFFRGFLVPRLGIIPSAIIFGLAHYSYNSTFGIEVIAAFIFGLLSGYIYKKTGSIYPGIVAHILINSMAALSIAGMY